MTDRLVPAFFCRMTSAAGFLSLVALSTPAFAQDDFMDAPQPGTDWGVEIWEAARDGDQERMDRMLRNIPADANREAADDLRKMIEARSQHMEQSDEDRDQGRSEAMEELRTEMEADNLSAALLAAVRLQTLSDDWNAVLDDEEIKALIAKAESRGQEQDDWLLVQEILFRLRTLHEDTGFHDDYKEYDERLDKVNRRIGLLARYAPRRLHELRNTALVRLDPEEETAEFNEAFAEDWKESLRGITQPMLRRALRTTATEHIANAGWKPLLTGGLEALALFASTSDLRENFPNLADTERVEAWTEMIEAQQALVAAADPAELGRRDYDRIMTEVLRTNPKTIAVLETVLLREFGEGAMYELEKQFEDQYTEIIWPEQLRRFQQAVQGEFVGVGILIRHDDKREIMIVNPLEGSPASRNGVEENDRIVQVNGIPTTGWSLTRAVDEITGPKGTAVTLGLRREGVEEPVEIPLIREVIKIRSVNGWWKDDLLEDGTPVWDWYVDEPSGIGYVRLTSFNDESFDDFMAAIEQMNEERELRGLVLDLRYNPGGLLESAVKFSNLFLERGEIVSCEDRNGLKVWSRRAMPHRARLKDLPLVVLVNQGSASASEIVSGCLQAHGAAVIVGERSFGKGSVQSLHDVSDRLGQAALKLTMQYYALPAEDGAERGRLVHKVSGAEDWGVNPDVIVGMTPAQAEEAYKLRRDADLIADWDEDRDPNSRPSPDPLIAEGIDPQLEMGILLLKARLLEKADPARKLAG